MDFSVTFVFFFIFFILCLSPLSPRNFPLPIYYYLTADLVFFYLKPISWHKAEKVYLFLYSFLHAYRPFSGSNSQKNVITLFLI